MKSNAKFSVTLPADELKLVNRLKKKLGAKSNVEVIRQGLRLLSESTEREALRQAYARAAEQVRQSTSKELEELDGLSEEGLGQADG
jgi:Arc/MetJ-type ribon-helix-helix transcriptional regulator